MPYLDFNEVKSSASGRWLSIFRELGIGVREDGKHGPCPHCSGGSGKSDRFRLDKDSAERGTYFCNGCGPGDGISLVQKVLGEDFKGAIEAVARVVGVCEKTSVPKEKTIDPEMLRKMFLGSRPVQVNDLTYQYLSGRGIKSIPPTLRNTTRCYEPESKEEIPAMLAVVTLPNNDAVTIHRTYLDPITAGKADVEKAKKLMPGLKKITGGAIRLYQPVDGHIGVAEGIETALACVDRFGIPCWATISSTMMESFEPPKGITKVTIFGDNDRNYAGEKAAYTLAHRLVLKKLSADVVIPRMIGDWADYTDLDEMP